MQCIKLSYVTIRKGLRVTNYLELFCAGVNN